MLNSGIIYQQNPACSVQSQNMKAHGLHNSADIRIFVLAMTNEEYIQKHRHEDVRALALQKPQEGVDTKWCLQQIEGWQKSLDKLPHWAQTEGLWYPPALSMEQCSSEHTAIYKSSIVQRILEQKADRKAFADLTGGYGIDFSYIAVLFEDSAYIERNANLCRIAEHNFGLLHLDGAKVICADSAEFLQKNASDFSLIYLDPARRDGIGRKTVAITDCTPDIRQLQDHLLDASRYVLIKLSPMLDLSAALSVLKHVREIHVVSVKGECKELLFLQDSKYEGMPVYYAANLASDDKLFCCSHEQKASAKLSAAQRNIANTLGNCLYEPNASILKAGLQDVLCLEYGVSKLHPMSNLFTSAAFVEGFPGRSFDIVQSCGFSKRELRSALAGISKANITIRNFPASVAELRKKLHLGEGGDVYLFATTMANGSHILVRCSKHL